MLTSNPSREVHLNKTYNGESVDLRNGKYQRRDTVSIKRLHVAILEISYEPCARKATKTKFEKLNYKKKEWYEPSKFEKSPH